MRRKFNWTLGLLCMVLLAFFFRGRIYFAVVLWGPKSASCWASQKLLGQDWSGLGIWLEAVDRKPKQEVLEMLDELGLSNRMLNECSYDDKMAAELQSLNVSDNSIQVVAALSLKFALLHLQTLESERLSLNSNQLSYFLSQEERYDFRSNTECETLLSLFPLETPSPPTKQYKRLSTKRRLQLVQCLTKLSAKTQPKQCRDMLKLSELILSSSSIEALSAEFVALCNSKSARNQLVQLCLRYFYSASLDHCSIREIMQSDGDVVIQKFSSKTEATKLALCTAYYDYVSDVEKTDVQFFTQCPPIYLGVKGIDCISNAIERTDRLSLKVEILQSATTEIIENGVLSMTNALWFRRDEATFERFERAMNRFYRQFIETAELVSRSSLEDHEKEVMLDSIYTCLSDFRFWPHDEFTEILFDDLLKPNEDHLFVKFCVDHVAESFVTFFDQLVYLPGQNELLNAIIEIARTQNESTADEFVELVAFLAARSSRTADIAKSPILNWLSDIWKQSRERYSEPLADPEAFIKRHDQLFSSEYSRFLRGEALLDYTIVFVRHCEHSPKIFARSLNELIDHIELCLEHEMSTLFSCNAILPYFEMSKVLNKLKTVSAPISLQAIQRLSATLESYK